MPVIIGRPIEGIHLNGLEYVLDKPEEDDGVPIEFEDRNAAIKFMEGVAENPELIQTDLDEGSIVLVDAETNEVL